jgi:hypothetical protein
MSTIVDGWAVDLRVSSDCVQYFWMKLEAVPFVRVDLVGRTITEAITVQEKLDMLQGAGEDTLVFAFDGDITQKVIVIDDREAMIEALQ